MGILNSAIVQPILFAAYAVYVALGIGAIVLGAIFSAKAGQTNIGMGILVVGAFMLVLGGIAVFATKTKQWLILFLVEIINVVLLIVLFVLSVQLMIIGTGKSDPITDSVRDSWADIRIDLETSSYCDNSGGDSCDEYYFYFKQRTDFTGDYYCPGIADEDEGFYSSNCTKYELLDDDMTGCITLGVKCELCDGDCLEQFVADTQAYMGPVAVIIWALFLFLSCEIVWNNIIMESSGDDFAVEGLSALVSHLLNAVVFLFGFLVMILGLISIGLIKNSCPEGESCIGWTSTGLVLFGALIFVCAVLVSIAVWKDIQILLQIVDDILIILCFLLMLCAIPVSMTAGLLTNVSDFYEANYHTVRAELESYDNQYCSYPETCDKKEALKETCGSDGSSKCCVTCSEKWGTLSSTDGAACISDPFFSTTQVEINAAIDLSDTAAVEAAFSDSADRSWAKDCEGDEIDIVCGLAVEALTSKCAFGYTGLDGTFLGTLDAIYGADAYAGILEDEGQSTAFECLYETDSINLAVYGDEDNSCESATISYVSSGSGYDYVPGQTRGNLVIAQNCDGNSFANGNSGTCDITELDTEDYATEGYEQDGTGGYAMVCGDSNTVKIVGGWQSTANLNSASLVDGNSINGVCLYAGYDTSDDPCKNFFVTAADGSTSVAGNAPVGECAIDVTSIVFDKNSAEDNTCDWLCQIKGGSCDDEGTYDADVTVSKSGNTWIVDGENFAIEDGSFVKYIGTGAAATNRRNLQSNTNDGYGSFTEYECTGTWKTLQEICEDYTDTTNPNTEGSYGWIENTCTRVGLCADTCVKKTTSDTALFPWTEVDTTTSTDDYSFYKKAGCLANDPSGCIADCENYGSCVTSGDVDADQDDYSDLEVCVWCSDSMDGAYTCQDTTAQLSPRGLSPFSPYKIFANVGSIDVDGDLQSIEIDLVADGINSWVDDESLVIPLDDSDDLKSCGGSGKCITSKLCGDISGGELTLSVDEDSCSTGNNAVEYGVCFSGLENTFTDANICGVYEAEISVADAPESYYYDANGDGSWDGDTEDLGPREKYTSDGYTPLAVGEKYYDLEISARVESTATSVTKSEGYLVISSAYVNMYAEPKPNVYTQGAFYDAAAGQVTGAQDVFTFGSDVSFYAVKDDSGQECDVDPLRTENCNSVSECITDGVPVVCEATQVEDSISAFTSTLDFATVFSVSVERAGDCNSATSKSVPLTDLCGAAAEVSGKTCSMMTESECAVAFDYCYEVNDDTGKFVNCADRSGSQYTGRMLVEIVEGYFVGLADVQYTCLTWYRESGFLDSDLVNCANSNDASKSCAPAGSNQEGLFVKGQDFTPLVVTDPVTIVGDPAETDNAAGCADRYVECGLSVGYDDDDGNALGQRKQVVFPTSEDTCNSFSAVSDFVGVSPNTNTAWTANGNTEFDLDSYLLASCDAEFAFQAQSNVVSNVRYSDGDDSNNALGPALESQEQGVAQAIYDYYLSTLDSDANTYADLSAVLQAGVDATSGVVDITTSSSWLTASEAIIDEYWGSVRYCNALPDLTDLMTASLPSGSTSVKVEAYLDLADEFIVANADFPTILSNRTQLDADYNPSGNAAEYLGKCALSLTSQTKWGEEDDDSVCRDLTDVVDANPSNPVDTTELYLEYCQACETVDFILYDEETTAKCFAFLMTEYASGIFAVNNAGAENCCTSLTDEGNRAAMGDAGVNVCKMTDEDCKSKVKRYIEKNASPIGIVIFVEVIFMYVVVYLTQKAITVFKDEEDEDDDDDDDDDE